MEDNKTPKRRRRLKPEDKWQIFLEATAKDAKVAEVLRRWGIDSSQLPRIREQVRSGALQELGRGPGRRPKDREKEDLKQELDRIEKAFKEVSDHAEAANGSGWWWTWGSGVLTAGRVA